MVEVQNAVLSTRNWIIIGDKEDGKGQLMTIGIDAKPGERVVDYRSQSTSDLGKFKLVE